VSKPDKHEAESTKHGAQSMSTKHEAQSMSMKQRQKNWALKVVLFDQREHIGIERRLRLLPLCLPVQYATTNAGHQLVAPRFFFIGLSERKFHFEQRSPPSIFPKNA
jgi:hypothetical protein